MGNELISGVHFFSLPPIVTTGGSVLHAIKETDEHFPQFGEIYFSTAEIGKPKAWKKHSVMICNLFVPFGAVKFVFFDDRQDSKDYGRIVEFILSASSYGRLVIHPGVWFGFCGIGNQEESIILNAASIKHHPDESLRLEPETRDIPFQWS